MDPLGLLLEIVAITVYPGGAFLAVLTWLTRRVGGMPAGTRAEEVIEGAGIVSVTTSPIARDRGQVMNAPSALTSNVLASSRNCLP